MTENGYPTYRRREDGHSFVNAKGALIDNRWVVPYCPFILLLMWCHCNLECCISVKAFKYIHKYVYKGHDRTSIGIAEDVDEIKEYLDARYVSASEATWRLMHFRMHDVSFFLLLLLAQMSYVLFLGNTQHCQAHCSSTRPTLCYF